MKKSINKTILQTLFPRHMSKAEQRKLKIIEAAIDTYADLGIEYVSFEDIARKGKMSRPLVQHYFPDKRVLFKLVVKYIRAQFQEIAVANLMQQPNPKEQLKEYIKATFSWPEQYPNHVRAWMFFFYICSYDEEIRAEHAELTRMGEARISALIDSGVKAKSFSPGKSAVRAKNIQRLITGAMIEFVTENDISNITFLHQLRDQVSANIMQSLELPSAREETKSRS